MRILLLNLLTACTITSDVSDGLVPPVGQIYKCDLIVQLGDPVFKIEHQYYKPCLAGNDQLNAWVQNWIDKICTPEVDANGGDGGCYGECDRDTGNLCFASDN